MYGLLILYCYKSCLNLIYLKRSFKYCDEKEWEWFVIILGICFYIIIFLGYKLY